MDSPDHGRDEATATIDDLSQAILAWLDQRPSGLARKVPSSSWSTPELQESFRENLDLALRTAISLSQLAAVTTYLTDTFRAINDSSEIVINRWAIALRERSSPETFDLMRKDITNLLARKRDQVAVGIRPGAIADLIVRALDEALSDEARRIPEDNLSPAGVLSYYMVPPEIRRMYNVRTFLFFLGAAVLSFIIYSVAQPGSWFNPGTSLFVLLAYATLIATAATHGRSKVKQFEGRHF